jgi:L-lactate utilization protein LutC
MTSTSVTLDETSVAVRSTKTAPTKSAEQDVRPGLRHPGTGDEAIAGQPDLALGSAHAITGDGTLVIASASGSQPASYTWGATSVIFVVGMQKLIDTLEAAREWIYQHVLTLEDARAQAAYSQRNSIGKVLEIHQELPPHPHRPRPPTGRL